MLKRPHCARAERAFVEAFPFILKTLVGVKAVLELKLRAIGGRQGVFHRAQEYRGCLVACDREDTHFFCILCRQCEVSV